jgi:hypothetical protein
MYYIPRVPAFLSQELQMRRQTKYLKLVVWEISVSENISWLPIWWSTSVYSLKVNSWSRRSLLICSLSACDNSEPQLWQPNCSVWQYHSSKTAEQVKDCIWLQHRHVCAVNSTEKWSEQLNRETGLIIVTKKSKWENQASFWNIRSPNSALACFWEVLQVGPRFRDCPRIGA